MILTILQNHIVTNAFSVRTGAGECLTLSVRDVASGDAESLLDVLRDILNDVAGVTDGKLSEHVQSMIAI